MTICYINRYPVIQQHDDHYLNKEKLTKLEETLKQRDEEISKLCHTHTNKYLANNDLASTMS